MKNISRILLTLSFITGVISASVLAQNPFITDQFTADPSHDILANENRGRIGWFCMADYHVFSSSDLVNWTDHGVIVTQE